MLYTNRYNLPESVVGALVFDDYDYSASGDYSASALIKSPRQRLLVKRHADEIELDVSDNVWKLFGSAAHSVLERTPEENVLKEERLRMDVSGIVVTGKPDHFQDGVIRDFKVTSVYAFLLGDKPDWAAQLNIYAHLVRHYGFPVERLEIVAILRDWTRSKAIKDDYPPAAIMCYPVKLWREDEASRYVEARLAAHLAAETLPDDQLPFCTPEERWERPTTYAVIKRGNKRAYRVCDSQEAATTLRESLDGVYDVVERPGVAVRCQSYCLGSPWCNQYQSEVENDNKEDQERIAGQ